MGSEILSYWSDEDLLKVCSGLSKKYRGYVDFDDIKQELVLWCLEDMNRARKLWLAPFWFRNRRLWTVGERYARAQKARMVGYEIDDEFFYSPELVRGLLPDALDPGASRPVSATDEPKVKTDGATGNEWATMVADVRRALDLASKPDLDLLTALYGPWRLDINSYADMKRWDYKTAWSRHRRALRRLVDLLGGTIPWVADRDWEDRQNKLSWGPESPQETTELVGGVVG